MTSPDVLVYEIDKYWFKRALELDFSGKGKGKAPLFILDNHISYLSCSP